MNQQASRKFLPAGSVAVVVLVVVVLVALGVVADMFAAYDPPPPILATATGGGQMSVSQQSFDDARTTSLAVVLGDAPRLTSQTSGRVTASKCVAGATATSGKSLFAVDGVSLLGLATKVPLWRDIRVGDSGSDVKAVITELIRLGVFKGEVPSKMTSAVVRAWRAYAIRLGVPAGSLPVSSIPQRVIVWLPTDGATIDSCAVRVGDGVAYGVTLATFAAPVVSARVTGQFTGLVPGPRVLVVDNSTSVSVDDSGQVSGSADLAVLAASPTVRMLDSIGQLDTLTGRYALAMPIEVSVVAPSAIVAYDSSHGCVQDTDGVARSVTVVSNQLGQSFVVFDDNANPPAAVSLNPPENLSCR